MNEEPTQVPQRGGDTSEPAEKQLTVNEAAHAIGVDSFTIQGLIQRGKLNPARSPWGEIMMPKSELIRLIEKGR
jgi:predicted site-specific integrase-resolvase